MISSVQKIIGKRLISSALKKRKKKKIFNFQTAKTMGIVFMTNDKWNMKILEDFIQTAKKNNIQCHAIGWINKKDQPPIFKENGTIKFLSKKDLNFWGIPNSEKFRNFIARKYDILIDFSLHHDVITSLISAKADAGMKMAKDIDETKNIFDFLIKLDENTKQSDLFEQVIYYLNTINAS